MFKNIIKKFMVVCTTIFVLGFGLSAMVYTGYVWTFTTAIPVGYLVFAEFGMGVMYVTSIYGCYKALRKSGRPVLVAEVVDNNACAVRGDYSPAAH